MFNRVPYLRFIFGGTLLAGLFLMAGCGNLRGNDGPPNIVLVLADDLGVPQVGCYGSEYYETPNIDRLAEKGARFTQAYSAAAVCSPTRAALLTGKNPARLHITDFIAGNSGTDYPLKQPGWQKFLPLEEQTLGEILKEHGYNTALFGKWHLSPEKTPPGSLPYNPDKQGFDESFVTYKPAGNLPIGDWQVPEKDGHSVDTLTSLAIDFVERHKNAPFFVMVSHNSIHDPLMEREASIEKFRAKSGADAPENNAVIAAMVNRIDQAFGRLYGVLEENHLLENTVVIFYSDNGAKEAYAAQTPFRKGKGWLYEGGIRVPLVISWPGKVEHGMVIKDPVTSMDLFSTITALAGADDEADREKTFSMQHKAPHTEGINLLPRLLENHPLPQRTFFWNYPHYHKGSGMKPACAVRSGKYKLIQWYEPQLLNEPGALELYNLASDPSETKNLVEEMPGKKDFMILLLEEMKRETGAQEPTPGDES